MTRDPPDPGLMILFPLVKERGRDMERKRSRKDRWDKQRGRGKERVWIEKRQNKIMGLLKWPKILLLDIKIEGKCNGIFWRGVSCEK